MFSQRSTAALAAASVLTGALLALSGCSLSGGPSGAESGSGTGSAGEGGGSGVLRVVTHDSFAISDEALAAFEAASGLTVEFSAPGDGGALVNQLILTADAPLGDVAYGIDNSFATRAINAGVFAPYTPAALPASAAQYAADADGALTPIDMGDVCLNTDHAWFAEHGIAEPVTLEDLTKPEYRDLLVVTNPATSSPGLSFLLATVGAFGEDGWVDYWSRLAANGVKVVNGWSDAYSVDFSGSEGVGDRPIALSYATSPAFEVGEGETEAPTGALLGTCFRQVEYAGVLAGAENPEGAQAFIDFLVGEQFQAELPDQMYMYPVDSAIALPDTWAQFAPLAPEPFEVAPADIDAHRDEWIQTWTETVIG